MRIVGIPRGVEEVVKRFHTSHKRPYIIQITGIIGSGKSTFIAEIKKEIGRGIEVKPKYFGNLQLPHIKDLEVIYIHTWSGEPANGIIRETFGRNVDCDIFIYKTTNGLRIPNTDYTILLHNSIDI
jgi:hypothetical protein